MNGTPDQDCTKRTHQAISSIIRLHVYRDMQVDECWLLRYIELCSEGQ